MFDHGTEPMREEVMPSPEAAHRVAALSFDGIGTFEVALAVQVVRRGERPRAHRTLRGRHGRADDRYRIPFMPWRPVMSGALAQPGGVVAEIAKHTGSPPTQAAPAWLLARSDMLFPIPVPPRSRTLEENVAAPDRRADRRPHGCRSIGR
ncbi:hypothetical protein NBRGN_074_00320 [Nocardia brasiliensis NBRC 14402]|uniref:hypothetical protein n=1 Tax=Nocardia brasiliensis TaxID=37326 RepID=UPI0002F6BCA7|nr:hypothetical protein [Nocardia brasiliensis]ASF07039.1 hypothetical protein CEQ30_06465 [Nocardia brasiliensis]GAJ84481.1 hypothetical protein NBRGN_074_00320 [Nocardia brasiliensis NBRC 14402]